MSGTIAPQQMAYFGKLPARGDFVRGLYNPQLVKALDAWASGAMELLAEDPRWKAIYDASAPLHFVCLGPRSRLAIPGHLRASHDASSRRYPFMVAAPVEVAAPIDFMAGAPLLLDSFWQRAGSAVNALAAGAEIEDALKDLEGTPAGIAPAFKGAPQADAYASFVQDYSLLRLEQMLGFDGHKVSLRRLVLGLGLLLQPVMTSAVSHLEKGLTLPLPRAAHQQGLVAAFWLELVSRFLRKADFELVLLITEIEGKPRLVIGFGGLSPRSLQSVIHPQAYLAQNIEIDNPAWVEESIHSDYAMYKLVSYLDQPQLPLSIVLGTFREVFIGD